MRYLSQLAGLCLSLAAGAAHAQFPYHQACKGSQDPGPCLVAQEQPFPDFQPPAGFSAQIVRNNIVISWSGPAKEVRTVGEVTTGRPLPKLSDELRQVLIQYAQAAKVKSTFYVLVTQMDGTSSIKMVNLLGPQAAPLSEKSPV